MYEGSDQEPGKYGRDPVICHKVEYRLEPVTRGLLYPFAHKLHSEEKKPQASDYLAYSGDDIHMCCP